MLLFTAAVHAQVPEKPAKNSSKCGTIQKTYDRSKDETQVQLVPYLLEGAVHIDRESGVGRTGFRYTDWGFALTFLYSYKSKEYQRPERIKFFTLYDGQFFRYDVNHDVAFELGSEVLNIGSTVRTTEIPIGTQRVREQLAAYISADQLQKIASAPTVRLKVGRDIFDLTPCQIAGISKLAKTIK